MGSLQNNNNFYSCKLEKFILLFAGVSMILGFVFMIRKRYLHHELLKFIYPEELGNESFVKDISGFGKFLGIDSIWVFSPIYWYDCSVDLNNKDQLKYHKKLRFNNVLFSITFILFIACFILGFIT